MKKFAVQFAIATVGYLSIAQTPAMAIPNFSPLPNEMTEQNIDVDVEAVAESMLFGFVCCQSLMLIKLSEL